LKPQWENPDPQPTGDNMTNKNEERITELEEKVSELEDLLNQTNDDLDHALNMANKVEAIIAAWNKRFPEDAVAGRKPLRPEHHYAMTDKEWKERTRIPHPHPGFEKKFNPKTGAWE
jgi:uncharacterized coiled-coil protein SlyX